MAINKERLLPAIKRELAEAGVPEEELQHTSVEDALDKWLTAIGIIRYTSSILLMVDSLRLAEVRR